MIFTYVLMKWKMIKLFLINIAEGTTTMHLKVVKVASDPPHVSDHHVPIFIMGENMYREQQWDLTTQQVLTFWSY
jgi:hypothetical protein